MKDSKKVIVIGDIHAKTIWKSIVEKEFDADKFVFIGDYFDSFFGESTEYQLKNFEEILELKRQEPDRFFILMGNHDYHYIPILNNEQYSGYQSDGSVKIGVAITKAIEEGLVQMCHKHGKHLFTHAGVTKTWMSKMNITDTDSIEYSINGLPVQCFEFYRGDFSGYGDDVNQSCIWVRPDSLIDDLPDGLFQVVGHTKVPQITYLQYSKDRAVTLIDCLDRGNEYLQIIGDDYCTKML